MVFFTEQDGVKYMFLFIYVLLWIVCIIIVILTGLEWYIRNIALVFDSYNMILANAIFLIYHSRPVNMKVWLHIENKKALTHNM